MFVLAWYCNDKDLCPATVTSLLKINRELQWPRQTDSLHVRLLMQVEVTALTTIVLSGAFRSVQEYRSSGRGYESQLRCFIIFFLSFFFPLQALMKNMLRYKM